MGLLERVEAERNRRAHAMAWPVGPGEVDPYSALRGHDDSRFSPASYGDYIATSNDIYSIVTLRAKLLARRPIRIYDQEGPDKREITTGALYELLRHVNPFWTPVRLKLMTEMSLGLWGEAYWVLERDRRDVPVEIWVVRPSQMTPVPHPTRYLAGYLYQPANGGEQIPFATRDVVWIRYPNPLDEFSPLSPLAAARLAADTAMSMMRQNKALFDNGMALAGVISPPKGVTYDEDQATKLERRLEERFKGADKAHRWAVLRFDAQVNPFTVSQRDAEFVNGLNLTLRQACNAYQVPSPMLNDLEHATLANAKEFQQMLWDNALAPECEFIAEELREQLLPQFPPTRPRSNYVEFDLSGVAALREAENAVWERERGQIEVGALKVNEWRTAHGLPPVPWGDVWWAPVNKAPIDDEGRVAPAAPAPEPVEPADPADPEEQAAEARILRSFLDAVTHPALAGNGRR